MLQPKSRRRRYPPGGRLAALDLHWDRHFHFASEQEAGLISTPIEKGAMTRIVVVDRFQAIAKSKRSRPRRKKALGR